MIDYDSPEWVARRERDRKLKLEEMAEEVGLEIGDTPETCLKKLLLWLHDFKKDSDADHERIDRLITEAQT